MGARSESSDWRSGIRVAPAEAFHKHWECADCGAVNNPGVAFCQRCGQLARALEEDLLVHEEFFVLDGLKALAKGDEETAHRCFTLATENNADSVYAWYWRTRSAETVDELITCLEQTLRLMPDDERVRVDLDQARERKRREETLAANRARTARTEAKGRGRPSTTRRSLDVVRGTALDLASVPSFVLGLLWGGPIVVDALAVAGVHELGGLFPVFRLPGVVLPIFSGGTGSILPGTLDVTRLAMLVAAGWFLWLAFRLGERAGSARSLAIGSGFVAVLASRAIASNGKIFVLAALLLIVLAVVGTRSASEPSTDARIAA